MIPESFKQDLLNRIDIVDLIERSVPLKKGGANFVACCPFHSEKSASFTVSPTKQFYHCFGCGAHGNAISFLMEYQGLGYVEAVKELAESVGMKLPAFEPVAGAKPPSPDLYDILERAARFYREQLKSAPLAIEYLKQRGLTGQIAARFGIGYAPDGWQALQSVFTDYAGKDIKEAGLVIDAEGGRRYDRFRDRIMFPILNQRGAAIGFGGRVLGAGEPKYLNSPETPLFEKGRELYGLSQARNAIRANGRVVVVEGYMDVVALAQHGVENSVATLGTATSPFHIQKLFRQTDEIVFCFDGDAAGRRAAWHALEVALPLLADSKGVKFLFLPQEHDPDSFVRKNGAAAFEAAVGNAMPLSEYLLSGLKARVDLGTAEGRAKFLASADPLLKRMEAPILKIQLTKQLQEAANLSARDIVNYEGNRFKARGGRPPLLPRVERSQPESLERGILRYLVAQPNLARLLPMEFLDSGTQDGKALIDFVDLVSARFEANSSIGALWDALQESKYFSLYKQLIMGDMQHGMSADEAEPAVRDALRQLERRHIDRRISEVHKEKDLDDLRKGETLRALHGRQKELDEVPEETQRRSHGGLGKLGKSTA